MRAANPYPVRVTTPTTPARRPWSTIILAITLGVLLVTLAAALALGWLKPRNTPAAAQAPTASAAAGAKPSAAATVSISEVLARLTRAGLPLSNPAAQDENTDPNNLLGRPNGYIARASFDVPGGDPEGDQHTIERGGVIEVWPDEAAARRRSTYLQDLVKNAPILGTEYDYVRGPVLLRITGKVKPSVAAQFEAAL